MKQRVVEVRDRGSFVVDRATLRTRGPSGLRRSLLLVGAVALAIAGSAGAQSQWVLFGNCPAPAGLCDIPPPPPGTTYVQLDLGGLHGVGLVSDGTIIAWGDNSLGQCNVPAPPPGTQYVEVSGGYHFSVARLSDGNVVAWGYNGVGQLDVPELPPGLTYVEVDAGEMFALARRSDGAIVSWGLCPGPLGQCYPSSGQPEVPFVEISAGGQSALARLTDGRVFYLFSGTSAPPLPPGVTYVEIAAAWSGRFGVARRSDGTVVAWGYNDYGQCDVPPLPPGTSYVEIGAGARHTVLRRSDGAVLAFGDTQSGVCDVPDLPPGFAYGEIAVGWDWTIARMDPLPACGSVSSYCWQPAPNSAGPGGASFEVSGCPGLSANDLVFAVGGLPPLKFGLFYYGSQQKRVAYGNGWACIAGTSRRVRPGFVSDAAGNVIFSVDLTQFPFTGSPQAIQPGSAWNFQYWYRDTAGSPSTFNYSDGRHVVFSP